MVVSTKESGGTSALLWDPDDVKSSMFSEGGLLLTVVSQPSKDRGKGTHIPNLLRWATNNAITSVNTQHTLVRSKRSTTN